MQTFYLDFQSPGIQPIIHAKQNDSLSRFFKVVLSDNGAPYTLPANAALSIRYNCGTSKGWYDTITLPGGTTRSAFSISGSEITCEIAAQCVLSPVQGELCLIIQNEGYKIGTFNLRIEVASDPCPDSTIEASDYFSVLTGQTAATLVNANAASASAAAAAESASEAANTLSSKANTEDVNNALALKADKTYVDARTTDYIVEQGKSGIWAYRKWNSGKFDMCGLFNNASSGMTINFPFAVEELYGSFVCGHYNTSTSVTSFYSFDFNNGATSGTLHAFDPSGSQRTISTLSGQIYIYGRYK